MSIIVTARRQPPPDQLERAIDAFRQSWGEGPGRARRTARVFARLGESTDLLGVGEWDSVEDYEAHRRSPRFADAAAALDGLAHVRYFERLTAFERVLEPVGVVACALIDARPDTAGPVEAFARGQGRDEMLAVPGLRFHLVGRDLTDSFRFLVVHGWRDLADLEAFRRGISGEHQAIFASFGATIERFTATIVAEFGYAERAARRA
ncbi:MAG: hypothetical protein IT305_11855 [Chloroflexi bacterium]|nr:hypothetical protein [Chloroflexota bacterium]